MRFSIANPLPQTCIVVAVLGCVTLSVRSIAADEHVEATREALKKNGPQEWYDQGKDTLRRVKIQDNNWSMRGFTPLGSFISGVGLIATIVITAILFGLLLSTLFKATIPAPILQRATTVAGKAQRIHKPPIEIGSLTTNFLAETNRCCRDGNYGQAIVYLFCYQLVELDRCQLITLTRGKTNRQYLREIETSEVLRHLFEQSMIVFEDAFFGNHLIDRPRFEKCWNRLSEFQSLIQKCKL